MLVFSHVYVLIFNTVMLQDIYSHESKPLPNTLLRICRPDTRQKFFKTYNYIYLGLDALIFKSIFCCLMCNYTVTACWDPTAAKMWVTLKQSTSCCCSEKMLLMLIHFNVKSPRLLNPPNSQKKYKWHELGVLNSKYSSILQTVRVQSAEYMLTMS